MATFTGILSLLAALLFIAAGILLMLRRTVLLTTGMTAGALYLCLTARIPVKILTGLSGAADPSGEDQLEDLGDLGFISSRILRRTNDFLTSTSISNGAGTNLITASEVIGGVALITLVVWAIIRGFKATRRVPR